MAVGENDPFVNQTVQVRGIHMGVPQGVDRVIPLLVGDDENDVRAIIGHVRPLFSGKIASPGARETG